MNEWVPAIITTAGALFVAYMTYRSTRKGDKEANALTKRRDTITDRDALIAAFQSELERRDDRLNDFDRRLKDAEEEIKLLRNHNNALITFIYKLIAIIRGLEALDHIRGEDVPDGIHL